jgi:hypothetical protein
VERALGWGGWSGLELESRLDLEKAQGKVSKWDLEWALQWGEERVVRSEGAKAQTMALEWVQWRAVVLALAWVTVMAEGWVGWLDWGLE